MCLYVHPSEKARGLKNLLKILNSLTLLYSFYHHSPYPPTNANGKLPEYLMDDRTNA